MNLKLLSILTFSITILSCHNSKVSKPLTAVKNNDVNISYTDSHQGDTTILFVHGWCINKTYWQDQINCFNNNYRVITMDLPGYGQSGKNRSDFSLKAYATDVNALIDQLDLKNVILIGHSMAGDIILQAALHNPEKVIGLIGIDNFKSVGIEPTDSIQAKKDFESEMISLRKNFKRVAVDYFNKQLFYKTTSNAVKNRILNDVTHADSIVAIKNMEDSYYDELKLLKQLNKKLYLLNSDYDSTDISGLKANRLPYDLTFIHATGHFPMVEKPGEFNQLLAGVLKRIR